MIDTQVKPIQVAERKSMNIRIHKRYMLIF